MPESELFCVKVGNCGGFLYLCVGINTYKVRTHEIYRQHRRKD